MKNVSNPLIEDIIRDITISILLITRSQFLIWRVSKGDVSEQQVLLFTVRLIPRVS